MTSPGAAVSLNFFRPRRRAGEPQPPADHRPDVGDPPSPVVLLALLRLPAALVEHLRRRDRPRGGGAVARDEKISVRQALRFSTGKVLSFVFAPLIPIIIVLVLAVILGVRRCRWASRTSGAFGRSSSGCCSSSRCSRGW
jgi:hypothetical protein